MAALHDALKTLGPTEFSEVPLEDPKDYISRAFSAAQLIIDSIPIPPPGGDSSESRSRSNTTSSVASSASEISISSARSDPPPPDVEALQKEWKAVKLNPKENPLGMSVYKLGGKDGKGAWFARRSVHEGLGFTKWKKGLEREFPETMKVKGPPGEGNIRGIGGERRVEFKNVDGVGKLEVYLLTAQFPGPTTPRDFVTMLLTSDQALKDPSGKHERTPRHYMVISKPCIHPETPPREGFIRGQYESVEFIREIPVKKGMKKSASATNLSQSRNGSGSMLGREAVLRNAKQNHAPPDESEAKDEEKKRARGKTISFDKSRGSEAKGEDVDIPKEDDESESNPVEWIMVTRSDPGGSVPRFMIERGTPGGIVADASKFLNWACAKDIEDFESDEEADGKDEKHEHKHGHEKALHDYQTNGHLAGIDEAEPGPSRAPEDTEPSIPHEEKSTTNGGVYGIVASVAGAIASHTPAIISNNLPGHTDSQNDPSSRRNSTSSDTSSAGSFASAVEQSETRNVDAESLQTTTSSSQSKAISAAQDKELAKLEEKKRKLAEKLNKAREKEQSKKIEDSAKEEKAVRRVEEKHEKEVSRQEEKYKKEVERLERKKEREERKAEERRRKSQEKDERTRLLRELEEAKAELGLLRKEKELLTGQVGDLQRENTALAARVGKLGVQGEEVLREVRGEGTRGSRIRAKSLMGLGNGRPSSVGSGSRERERQKENIKEVA